MGYITQTEIEEFFGGAITLDSNFATNIIERNSNYVEQIAGTKFEPTNVTEEINLDVSTDLITLSHSPIISITNVYVNKGDEFTPDWQTTSYSLISTNPGVIRLKTFVTAGFKKVKVEYTYGFAQVPYVVKKLVLDLCVIDVLRLLVNTKSANDEGDVVDLGQIRVQGSYSQALANARFVQQEIEELKRDLYNLSSYYR